MCNCKRYPSALLKCALVLSVFALWYLPSTAEAATITLRYQHHLFYLNPDSHPEWQTGQTQYEYNGMPISVLPFSKPAESGGWEVVPELLPDGIEQRQTGGWNTEAIVNTIAAEISTPLNLTAGEVHIKGGPDLSEPITFEGVGLPGREVREEELAQLLMVAAENGKTDITIPVRIIQPKMTIDSPELRSRGIQEVVALGESEFIGSTQARQHNIRTGLSKFNGTLVPKDSVFSFNEVLGPVNGATGYLLELVIQGDRTVPEYGGGLCQVSTTAYRGIWEYGFPIESRRNHSYTVSYYYPQGTDATIYPGVQDMKFTNDSPGDLLIQTHTEGVRAYFIYYGTKDNRQSSVIGPYIWGRTGVGAKRTEYVDDLPPGVSKVVQNPVAGMKAAWFRTIQRPNEQEVIEPYYSSYQSRGLFTLIGRDENASGDTAAPDDPNAVPVPSWLLGEDVSE